MRLRFLLSLLIASVLVFVDSPGGDLCLCVFTLPARVLLSELNLDATTLIVRILYTLVNVMVTGLVVFGLAQLVLTVTPLSKRIFCRSKSGKLVGHS